jgi:hypothetical protein
MGVALPRHAGIFRLGCRAYRPRPRARDLKSALSAARLVILVGPGGVGKTRLVRRSATDLRRGIADRAQMIETAGAAHHPRGTVGTGRAFSQAVRTRPVWT